MPIVAQDPSEWQRNCETIKDRWLKILDLLETQANTIHGLSVSPVGPSEGHEAKIHTKYIRENTRHMCDLFDQLVKTSNHPIKAEVDQHPALPQFNKRLQDIRASCEKCSSPIGSDASGYEMQLKRLDCSMAEELITSGAHMTPLMEDTLVDSNQPNYWSILVHWRDTGTPLASKGGLGRIHDFYEELMAHDDKSALELVKKQRMLIKKAKCQL